MKKVLSLVVTLSMLLLCACASADTNYIGDWYADLFGTELKLTLNADGTYINSGDNAEGGVWEADASGIICDKGTADELPLAYDAQSNTLTGDVSGVALVFSRRTGPEAYNGQWAATLLRLGEIEAAPRDVEFEVRMTVEDGLVCMSLCFGEEAVTLNIQPQFEGSAMILPLDMADGSASYTVPCQLLEDGTMTVTFPADLFGEEAIFVLETV